MTPLINGTRHSWASIEITLFNRLITGITEIKYEKEREYEDQYGAGDQPVHRGIGNTKYTGASIKLYKYEIDAIEEELPAGKDITDIAPFSIKVVFRPEGSDKIRVETLKNVQITKRGFASKQGDKMIEIEVPIIYAGLKVGV